MSSSPTTGRAEADGVDRPTLRCQQSSINGERNGKQHAQHHRSQRRTREVDHVSWPNPTLDDGGSKGERHFRARRGYDGCHSAGRVAPLSSFGGRDADDRDARRPSDVKNNIALLYGFSFFDQFMIVIALWIPYLATQGISMRQFMELQAVFAFVILSGEVPSGLLSDQWGRKKTLLLGTTLKAVSFSLLP